MIQVTVPNFFYFDEISKIRPLELKNTYFWPFSENKAKKCLTKVVGNDPSYCSKFFLFCRNLKNERARAKKR